MFVLTNIETRDTQGVLDLIKVMDNVKLSSFQIKLK